MNKTEERKYSQLKKLGQELHIPIPEAFWELEVRDKDGKVIQRLKQRSHSWTRNAYNHLLCQMASKNLDSGTVTFGAGYLNIRFTTGTIVDGANTSSLAGESLGWGYRGAAGSSTIGIIVGGGTDAESFEDYALQTPISEGTGAGQLNYVATDAPTKSYNAGAKVWTINWVRYINNNSGGIVSINEVGIAGGGSVGGSGGNILVTRDKLPSTVNVPNTGQLKVTYTIQLTYPA